MPYTDYDLKSALPNKSYNEDGTTTDLLGNIVNNPVPEYENKQSLPNKWLNPDGSYSTLLELISEAIDTELFIVVEELPASGETNKIYLLVNGDNLIEYLWTGSKWDPIGMIQFDLSQYSTTEQMNAAINAALNSAKAYTDTSITNYNVIFFWDGTSSLDTPSNLTLWQNIYNKQLTKDCLVLYSNSSTIDMNATNPFKFVIGKNTLSNNKTNILMANGNFTYTVGTSNTSPSLDIKRVDITVSNDEVTNVSGLTHVNSVTYGVLDTEHNYQTPYTPQYPGSPATKKYVDDSISTNITQVLGGSY